MYIPKKLRVYMSFNEQKIQEMIDKQISEWQDKIKEKFDVGEIFPIEFQKKYPDKWKKVLENQKDLYKLIHIINQQDKKRLYLYEKNIDILYQTSYISNESIYKFIREILYLEESEVKELEYWKNLIFISYDWNYKEKELSDIKFGDINLYLNKYKKIYEFFRNNSTSQRYYYKNKWCRNKLLVEFVINMCDLNEKMQYKIMYNTHDKELHNLIHNLNYYEICCKIIMNTDEKYLTEYGILIIENNKQRYYSYTKRIYTIDNNLFKSIKNIVFGN